MFRKVWALLTPFHNTFLAFVLIAVVYESIQLAGSYVTSLVVTLFGAGVDPVVWVFLIIGLLVFDEINMRIDNYFDWHIITKQSHPIFRHLKLAAIAKFLKMDIPWHHKHNSGTLVGKVNDGVWKTLDIIDMLSWEFVPTLIQALLSLIPLFLISPWVGWIAVLTFVVFAWFTVKGNKEKKPFRSRRQDYYEAEWNKSIASVQSIETNLMFGQQERLIQDQRDVHDGIIDQATQEHRIGIYKYNRWRIRILTISRRIILCVWIWQLLNGSLTIASLIFVSVLIERLYSSFWRFARLLDRAAESSEGSERLVNLLTEAEPVETGTIQKVQTGPMGVSIRDVCFAYDGDYSEYDGALHNFSLDVEPGKIVALVGPSGAGKTTIRKIVTRLVNCQKGTIEVAGIDIRDWDKHQLLEQFSYVPQGDDVYIFEETIFYNIAFPRPDAVDEEIVRAAKLAGIHDFIIGLKDGYGTQVGERGVRLSGGQKQRVALARAILADRPILILDEATSAVDAITESEIQENMRTILQGRTAIIIAHRLSTIWGLADKIVVMDNGRKVEEGTHEELSRSQGIYAQMVALQTE
jgi:ATP-binding cassette, subfamily B, heavy metal transporter